MLAMPITYAVSGCNDTNVVIGGDVDAILTLDHTSVWKEADVDYGVFEMGCTGSSALPGQLEFCLGCCMRWR